jgi:hypothetical protein
LGLTERAVQSQDLLSTNRLMTRFKSFINQPEMAGLPSGGLEWLKLRTSEPLGPVDTPFGALLLEVGVGTDDLRTLTAFVVTQARSPNRSKYLLGFIPDSCAIVRQ